ncbi:MAG: hypothetical protein ABIG93_00870 [archaeon]
MIEAIFETKRGVYQLDTETGLFTLRDKPSSPKRFLGSVDPNMEIHFDGLSYTIESFNPYFRPNVLLDSLVNGHTEYFTPDFVEGYRPFGITCELEDLVSVGQGILVFTPEFIKRLEPENRSIKFELGSKIDHVYRQLTADERGYDIIA